MSDLHIEGHNKGKERKKISFISLVVMLVGGTIGAGIFYKNEELLKLAQGHFSIVLTIWGIGIIAMIALSVGLVEVISAQKTNLGVLEWTKKFTPKWLHKTASNYLKWIFTPLQMFAVPVVVIQSLEGIGVHLPSSLAALGAAFAIVIWLMVTNLLSMKFAEASQWVFTILQTIPLLILPIIGIINWNDINYIDSNHHIVSGGSIMHKTVIEKAPGLSGTSPYLTFVSGLGSIAFAFSGFTVCASMRNEMKEPQKIGKALLVGVLFVAATYLIVTFGFNIAGNGSITGMENFMPPALYKVLRVCVLIGIVAIINNMAMGVPRQFSELSEIEEGSDIKKLKEFMFKKSSKSEPKKRYLAGWIYTMITIVIVFAVLGLVGVYGYKLVNDGDHNEGGARIYAFAQVLLNYVSVVMFAIITSTVAGALLNRKTKKVSTEKAKYFVPAAIVSVTIIFSGLIYTVISGIVDSAGFNVTKDEQTGSIVALSIFLGTILICFLPVIADYIIKYRRSKI